MASVPILESFQSLLPYWNPPPPPPPAPHTKWVSLYWPDEAGHEEVEEKKSEALGQPKAALWGQWADSVSDSRFRAALPMIELHSPWLGLELGLALVLGLTKVS